MYSASSKVDGAVWRVRQKTVHGEQQRRGSERHQRQLNKSSTRCQHSRVAHHYSLHMYMSTCILQQRNTVLHTDAVVSTGKSGGRPTPFPKRKWKRTLSLH